MEESIYNIVPKQYGTPVKGPLYKSKYPHNIPPTGSTFCHKTTSKPGLSNLSGDFAVGLQSHTEYAQTGTLGHLKGDRKSSPDNFIRKHTGTMGNETLPPVRNFSYDCTHKRQSVPKSTERPIHGLKSGRDFLVSNAVEAILSTPKQSKVEMDWTKKRNYGQNPEYLDKIKDNLHNEYQMIQSLHRENEQHKKVLGEEEVQELRDGLKRAWNQLNREYQRKSYIKVVDTYGLKNRKETMEKQMAEIQNDIKKLNKLYVFVEG